MFRALFKCDENKKDSEIFITRTEAAKYLCERIKLSV